MFVVKEVLLELGVLDILEQVFQLIAGSLEESRLPLIERVDVFEKLVFLLEFPIKR